jgi:septal ring-binding cell division protein DamX
MRHLETRTYTNVALTVLIILLAIMAIRPYVSLPEARAQFNEPARNQQQRRMAEELNPSQDKTAEATDRVAEATQKVAEAIRESAKSQQNIAAALTRFVDVPSGQ